MVGPGKAGGFLDNFTLHHFKTKKCEHEFCTKNARWVHGPQDSRMRHNFVHAQSPRGTESWVTSCNERANNDRAHSLRTL